MKSPRWLPFASAGSGCSSPCMTCKGGLAADIMGELQPALYTSIDCTNPELCAPLPESTSTTAVADSPRRTRSGLRTSSLPPLFPQTELAGWTFLEHKWENAGVVARATRFLRLPIADEMTTTDPVVRLQLPGCRTLSSNQSYPSLPPLKLVSISSRWKPVETNFRRVCVAVCAARNTAQLPRLGLCRLCFTEHIHACHQT